MTARLTKVSFEWRGGNKKERKKKERKQKERKKERKKERRKEKKEKKKERKKGVRSFNITTAKIFEAFDRRTNVTLLLMLKWTLVCA